jgi:membrane-associated protease RseP (regulator of RpoE activity)
MPPVTQQGRGEGLTRLALAAALLLTPAVCLRADPPQPEQPALPGFPNPADLQALLKSMMQLQQQQMQQQMEQLRKMQAGQLPGGVPGFGNPAGPARAETRLGVVVESPIEALVEQLDLPRGQGQVVTQVTSGGAAAKAGLQSSDILLELNGKTVASERAEFLKSVEDIPTNTPVNALVLRKGAKKELKGLTLPDMPAAAPGVAGGFVPPFPPLPPRPGFGFGGPGAANPFANGTFTGSSQEGGLSINVEGTIVNGTATVAHVTIQESGKPQEFNSLEQVPERYRDKVRCVVEKTTKGRAGGAPNR